MCGVAPTARVKSLRMAVQLLVHGVNILACGISTSSWWCSARNLALTIERAGSRGLAPCTPHC